MEILDARLQVDEQEMDFLILEELACSPPFAEWFLRRTGYEPATTSRLLSLGRSVSTYDGETDLLLVHATAFGKRALLIENKVGASFTKFQPERYRIRGQAGVDQGDWQEFATVLIAPQRYLIAAGELPFDARVLYEEIRQVVAAHGDPARAMFKLKLLDLAITKAKKPWTKVESVVVTDFFRAFRDFAVPRLPEITWPPENEPRAPGSTWVQIRIPPFPSRLLIEVKPDPGAVDLRLFGVPEGLLRGALAQLPEGAETVSAARSCAIRLSRAMMKVRSPFAGQEREAEEHLAAVQTLATFARQEAVTLFRLLGDPFGLPKSGEDTE
jgi:hypothetical protein